MPGESKSVNFNNRELKSLILSIQDWISYLISKWKLILFIVLFGITLGILVSLLFPPKYYATATFVLDNHTKANPVAALAGTMMEMDLEKEDNLFSGDNLIWLYGSDKMIKETLLSQPASGKESLMTTFLGVDRRMTKIQQKIKQKFPHSKPFPKTGMDTTDLGQQYLLAKAVLVIRKDYLKVDMEDQASGVIRVEMTSKNELFTLNFVNEIVNRVNTFYSLTKTMKAQEKVSVLQKKVDDFSKEMNTSMRQAAAATDAIPYANPDLQSLRVKPQREVVDVQVNSTLYTTMIQQLELAKITLAEHTPLIQMVDIPILPLKIIKPGLAVSIVVGGFLGFIAIISFLVAKRYVRAVMRN